MVSPVIYVYNSSAKRKTTRNRRNEGHRRKSNGANIKQKEVKFVKGVKTRSKNG